MADSAPSCPEPELSFTETRKETRDLLSSKVVFSSQFLPIIPQGFIDRSAVADQQGPIDFVKGEQGVWTCETGVLDGHQPDAITNLMAYFPIFAEGDFSELVKFVRPHKDIPDASEV